MDLHSVDPSLQQVTQRDLALSWRDLLCDNDLLTVLYTAYLMATCHINGVEIVVLSYLYIDGEYVFGAATHK